MSYSGKILYIDLTHGKIEAKPLAADLIKNYIGGWGINVRLAYEMITPKLDALSPDNPIIIGAGLLTGTIAPGTPKTCAMSKCPATGTISHGISGGAFGSMLKWAGYDHVVITGRAEKPSYIKINDDNIEICDAGDIWGKDIYEATDALKERYGERCSVACIGPSGENLVKIGIVLVDKGIHLGRNMAAVYGAKNLKAIVVSGSQNLKPVDRKRFIKTCDELISRGRADPLRDSWLKGGLFSLLGTWLKVGHQFYKHGTETYPIDRALELFGTDEFSKVLKHNAGCPSCLTCDKAVLQVKEGKYAGTSLLASTPLAVEDIGMRYGLGNMYEAVKVHDVFNRCGIDMATFNAMHDHITNCLEHGILTNKDVDGLDLSPGNIDDLIKLIERTAHREGFGAIVAEGLLGPIDQIIQPLEHHVDHIKGLYPDWDARVTFGLESVGSVVNVRPSYDMPISGLTIAYGRNQDFFKKVTSGMGFPQEDTDRIFVGTGFNLGRFLAHYEDWGNILNTFGVCFRMQVSRFYTINVLAELYSAGTGIEITPGEILKAVERAYNVYKAMNVREGFERNDDHFPEHWFTPLKHGDKMLTMRDYFTQEPITRDDTERLLDYYYEERGWNIERGIPTTEKLLSLGLDDVAQELGKL